MVVKLDPVTERLASAIGVGESLDAIAWLETCQQGRVMARRAAFVTAAGWLLVIAAAIVASFLSVKLSLEIRQLAQDPQQWFEIELPWRVTWLPYALVAVTVGLTLYFVIGSVRGILPGYQGTRSAIDWYVGSDAVTRLLASGCSYSEAFSTAARVVRAPSNRRWFANAVKAIDQGQPEIQFSQASQGDAATIEALIESPGHQPQRQWRIASEHFREVAKDRLTLLIQVVPLISTVLAAVLLWIALTSTLGWFWISISQMLAGLR